jgi:hypothetical protein
MGWRLSALRPELQFGSSIPSFLSPQAAALSHELFIIFVLLSHELQSLTFMTAKKQETVPSCSQRELPLPLDCRNKSVA